MYIPWHVGIGGNSHLIATALGCGCSIRDFIFQIVFVELRPGEFSVLMYNSIARYHAKYVSDVSGDGGLLYAV